MPIIILHKNVHKFYYWHLMFQLSIGGGMGGLVPPQPSTDRPRVFRDVLEQVLQPGHRHVCAMWSSSRQPGARYFRG